MQTSAWDISENSEFFNIEYDPDLAEKRITIGVTSGRKLFYIYTLNLESLKILDFRYPEYDPDIGLNLITSSFGQPKQNKTFTKTCSLFLELSRTHTKFQVQSWGCTYRSTARVILGQVLSIVSYGS